MRGRCGCAVHSRVLVFLRSCVPIAYSADAIPWCVPLVSLSDTFPVCVLTMTRVSSLHSPFV